VLINRRLLNVCEDQPQTTKNPIFFKQPSVIAHKSLVWQKLTSLTIYKNTNTDCSKNVPYFHNSPYRCISNLLTFCCNYKLQNKYFHVLYTSSAAGRWPFTTILQAEGLVNIQVHCAHPYTSLQEVAEWCLTPFKTANHFHKHWHHQWTVSSWSLDISIFVPSKSW